MMSSTSVSPSVHASREAILNERITPRAGATALMTATLWGGNSLSIKIALAGMPPMALACLRFVIGGLVVLLWARIKGISLRMEAGDWRGILSLSFLFLIQILLLNEGTHYTLASRSTILITTFPFFTTLFAHFFIPGDRLSSIKVAGLALAFLGVALLFAENLSLGDSRYLLGDLIVLASGVLLGERQVYTKRLTQSIPPCKVIVWQAALSVPAFALLSAVFERGIPYRFNPLIVGAILYQGVVVAGICFIIQISLLRRYRASRLSVFSFFTPVSGVVMSALLLGEPISAGLLGSMVMVGAGIAVVNREG